MDSSWNNHGRPSSGKRDFDWTKVAMGIALVLMLLGLFARGVYWITQNEDKIEGWAREQAKDDWSEARKIVQQLQTEDGALALYRGNPKLSKKFSTDRAFLEAVGQWRPRLEPLPDSIPPVGNKGFGHRMGLGGGMATINFKMENGSWLNLSWDGPSTQSTRQLIDLDVR